MNVKVEVDKATGKPTMKADHSGPTIEVVINHDTMIYRDETEYDLKPTTAGQSDEQKIQQVVQLVDLDSLDKTVDNEPNKLQVWGERRGDRVIAEVLVYDPLID